MKKKKIAEPDHDFVLEYLSGDCLKGQFFFSSELSIIKCTAGSATISINSRNHEFAAKMNFLLVEATLLSIVTCSDDFQIIMCRFSLQFMNEIYPTLDNKIFEVLPYSAPDLYNEDELEVTNLAFRQICLLDRRKDHPYHHKLVVNLVVNYILEIYGMTRHYIDSTVIPASGYRHYIIDSFFALCAVNHSQYRNIEYYAGKLNISSRYLYKITKELVQSTPKQIIDYYVSGSAKKWLLTTILTNQQIADKLNFPDQATFGQFFKRNVGMSPSEFRNKYR